MVSFNAEVGSSNFLSSLGKGENWRGTIAILLLLDEWRSFVPRSFWQETGPRASNATRLHMGSLKQSDQQLRSSNVPWWFGFGL